MTCCGKGNESAVAPYGVPIVVTEELGCAVSVEARVLGLAVDPLRLVIWDKFWRLGSGLIKFLVEL